MTEKVKGVIVVLLNKWWKVILILLTIGMALSPMKIKIGSVVYEKGGIPLPFIGGEK